MRGDGRLRLGRFLLEFRAAPAGEPVRAETRHRRTMVAQLSVPRRAGPADRLSPGGAALVAILAQRRGHRHHGRAALSRLDHRRGTAAAVLPARPCRLVGGGGGMAVAAHRAADAASQRERPWRAKPERGETRSVRSPATAGRDCGRWGGYGGNCPDMAIDQRREDGLALVLRYGAARRGHDAARRAGTRSAGHRRRAARQPRRAALRRLSGRHVGADDLWRAQPQPSRQP